MTKVKILFCPGLRQNLPKKAQAILAHLQHFRGLILILFLSSWGTALTNKFYCCKLLVTKEDGRSVRALLP